MIVIVRAAASAAAMGDRHGPRRIDASLNDADRSALRYRRDMPGGGRTQHFLRKIETEEITKFSSQ